MNSSNTFGRRAALLGGIFAISVAIAGYAPVIMAQEDAADDAAIDAAIEQSFAEEISVTGSLIPRPNLEGLSPVTVMGVEDITYSGMSRVEDLLATLPQAFTAQNSTIANGSEGVATIDLRYLGTARTLVLMNGRRMAPGNAGWSYAPDINMIPGAMLKRVDVLTGGASAAYGSDAVAGVVNFVIDQDFEGMRGGIGYSFYQHDNDNDLAQQMNADRGYPYPDGSATDGDGITLDLAFGGKFADGKGHASSYITYRKLQAATKGMRDYLTCSAWATGGEPICGGSGYIAEGRFIPYMYDPTGNHAGDRIAGDYVVSGDQFIPRTGEVYNYAPTNHIQRPDERWNAGAFVTYKWNEHVEGYMELMVMDDESNAQIAPTANFNEVGFVNCDNPLLSAQQRDLICVQGGYDAAGEIYADSFIGRRNVEGGPRNETLGHTSFRLLAGLRGDINDQWSYDVYGMHGQTNQRSNNHNNMDVGRMANALDIIADPDTGEAICRDPAARAAGCVPWNIFTSNSVDQAALDYMSIILVETGTTITQVLSATFNGDLEDYGWALPSATEGIQVALGASQRHEVMQVFPDDASRYGYAGSGGGSEPMDADLSVTDLFVEALVPLIQDAPGAQDLSLELGYRYSDYTTSGGASTYKALIQWAPIADFKVRAGYNRAIRSANIWELYKARNKNLSGSFDPCGGENPTATLEECLRTGVTADQYNNRSIALNSSNQYNTMEGGNPNLNPEIADTITAGFVITPTALPGFTATIDYYNIDIEDSIGTLTYATIMNVCIDSGDPTVCNLIHRDARGSLWMTDLGYIETANANVGTASNTGIDFSLNYMWTMGNAGLLSVDMIGTYFMDNTFEQAGISYDCVGYFGYTCGQPNPEWKHRVRVTWETNFNTTFALGWRYIGDTMNDFGSPDEDLASPADYEFYRDSGVGEFPAYHYFDLSGTYNFSDSVQFTFGINNITDKEPPMAPDYQDDSTTNLYATYDPLGRYVHTSLRFNF